MRKLFEACCSRGWLSAREVDNDRPKQPSPPPRTRKLTRSRATRRASRILRRGRREPETEEGCIADIEAEYHQPPKPAEAGLGETITLTGTNIGVRMRVTVTKVETGRRPPAVELELKSTGITDYEGPLTQRRVDLRRRRAGQPLAKGATAPCSRGPRASVDLHHRSRKTTSRSRLLPASGSQRADRFQLALGTVPVEAGGIWNLSSWLTRIDSMTTGTSGAMRVRRVGDDRADLVEKLRRQPAGDLAEQRVVGRQFGRLRAGDDEELRARSAGERVAGLRHRHDADVVLQVVGRRLPRSNSPGRRCRCPAGSRPGSRSPGTIRWNVVKSVNCWSASDLNEAAVFESRSASSVISNSPQLVVTVAT